MPIHAVTFDYGVLSTEARTVAERAAAAWRGLIAVELRSANSWIEKGRYLSQVWAALGHGHRLGWLKAETDLTPKTAERLIAAWALLEPHIEFDTLSNLPKIQASAVYALCDRDASDEIRATYLPRIVDGERGLRREILAAMRPAIAPDPPDAALNPDPSPEPGRARPDVLDEEASRYLEALAESDLCHLRRIAEALPAGVSLDALLDADRWHRAAPSLAAASSEIDGETDGSDAPPVTSNCDIEFEDDDAAEIMVDLGSEPIVPDADAKRIRRHALKDLRHTPEVEVIAPGVLVFRDE